MQPSFASRTQALSSDAASSRVPSPLTFLPSSSSPPFAPPPIIGSDAGTISWIPFNAAPHPECTEERNDALPSRALWRGQRGEGRGGGERDVVTLSELTLQSHLTAAFARLQACIHLLHTFRDDATAAGTLRSNAVAIFSRHLHSTPTLPSNRPAYLCSSPPPGTLQSDRSLLLALHANCTSPSNPGLLRPSVPGISIHTLQYTTQAPFWPSSFRTHRLKALAWQGVCARGVSAFSHQGRCGSVMPVDGVVLRTHKAPAAVRAEQGLLSKAVF